MRPSIASFVFPAALVVAALLPRGAYAQPNHQSCGMIPGCIGTMTNQFGNTTVMGVNRFFTGCPNGTCMVTMMNANGCQAQSSSLSAIFFTSTDTITKGCDFYCSGPMQNCSIRGFDGLPVELMEFSVEDSDESVDTREN